MRGDGHNQTTAALSDQYTNFLHNCVKINLIPVTSLMRSGQTSH
jgi:hypothetical protein